MKINWCKILGHKWYPLYLSGTFENIEDKVHLIAVNCSRCGYGAHELYETVNRLTNIDYETHNEDYFITNR